jgi:two-component system phosphate regulon sensor histidine kinase PhoR
VLNVVLVLVLCGAGAFFGGREGALAGALLAAMANLVWQRRALRHLICWARNPELGQIPYGRGLWGDVFAALELRSRRHAEEVLALTQSTERFRLAAQALPAGVVILDNHRRIEWINVEAEASLGLDAAHDVGKPINHLLREPAFVEFLETSGQGGPLEFRTQRNPGHVLQMQLAPFAQGRLILLIRDITRLEKLATMRRDFVANVSHELKTPLTVTLGFLETAQDALGDAPPEEIASYLRTAIEQGGRMRCLIDDLLTLSGLETDAPPPLEESVSLGDLISEIKAETLALSAGKHTVVVAAASAPKLRGSSRELHSAFLNLATNAVRYTPEGGHIRIEWKNTSAGGEFCVTDTGLGIAEEHISRLTERFYRVDRGRSRSSGGTGLGLAIVKHILERHGGSLHIESQVGVGSVFCARFSAARIIH